MTEPQCYLCGSSALTELTQTLRYGTGRVVFCPRCSLGMLEHDAEDLARYYAQEYRQRHGPRVGQPADYEEIFSAYVNYQGRRVERIARHLSVTARLLEVGCSAGQLLYNLKPLAGEVIGLDYDPGAAAFAAEKCSCVTYAGEVSDAPLDDGSFDVICAVQVLEHVPDPLSFIATLRPLLKPTGVVYIEVPNLLDPLLELYDNRAYRKFYFHRAHLFYFTARSLSALMERAGMEGELLPLQDYNFLNHLHWALTQTPQPDPHPGLGPARLPLAQTAPAPPLRELEAWAQRADEEYKRLLERHGVTDNIAFLGGPRAPTS
ncbi:MAG: class I SAM-dependent methyltransferase [Actinobacteria bacterium]|nr:MAG: class I SAM-dependent methyltransferase [Actinomycetota bacterium]